MGAEAKLYLQRHSIPQLFEGLMTGLVYNRPEEPLRFLETAIAQIRANPEEELAWDMFVDKREFNTLCGPTKEKGKKSKLKEKNKGKGTPLTSSGGGLTSNINMGRLQRSPSVMKAAEVAQIPHVPIILFMGGPGGGKTRHAARVANALSDQGLVHICMPDIIRSALAKYKDHYSEWKTANEHYLRGELIPNHLALALVKAEMGRHPKASAFFLEGFPREARQVEDFERQVQSVNMALILDYDEKTLREHMEKRGMGMEIIDQRIKEFKQKTLPSAKYFDDQRLLHLIPGEKDDQTIFERMRDLVRKAMSTGVPVLNSNPPSQAQTRVPTVRPCTYMTGSVNFQTSSGGFHSAKCILFLCSLILLPYTASSREGVPSLSGDSMPHGLSTSAPIILIIGAPGAQKSDIAKRTAQKYSEFVLLSMGALLRAKVAEENADELWQRIARKIDQGEPVPMKLCRELLYNELRHIGNASSGYIIEGYPRTEAQLIDLQSFVITDFTVKCGVVMILENSTVLEDDPEVVKTRMTLFKQNTLPMLKALDEKGILRVVRVSTVCFICHECGKSTEGDGQINVSLKPNCLIRIKISNKSSRLLVYLV
ncbi:unnamed protein product [Angiostrongylus costaricensis]|uniref:Adenylate kinase n=1 Tax=Angiostrongylus costaricensis TaxID=334426 RepID=A0A158PJ15_ANGCS|nr:unnamed protein product [Angiostrongylus costaricensis]